jgi:multiple sugar transport system substrate-binding protein
VYQVNLRHSVWLSVLFAGLLLFNCTSPEKPDHRKKLRFMFWGGYQDFKMWEKIKIEYESLYPDREIKLELTPGQYQDKLSLSLVGNTAADLIQVDDDYFRITAASGHLEDLSDYIKKDQAELRVDEFFPQSWEAFQFSGIQYAMPWEGFPVVLFYNKTLFDQSNLEYPQPDWNWEDMVKAAKVLTKDLDGDGFTDQFGINITASLLNVVPVIWSFGGDMLSEDLTRCTFNAPSGLQGLHFFQDLIFKYKVARSAEVFSEMTDQVLLMTGRVGMMIAGSYAIQLFLPVDSDMTWGIELVPSGSAGKFSRISFGGMAIYQKSKYKSEAWDFIRLLMSKKMQRLISLDGRGLPVRRTDALEFANQTGLPIDERILVAAMGTHGRVMQNVAAQGEISLLINTFLSELPLPGTDVEQLANRITIAVNKVLEKMQNKYQVWQ